jgi:hypothetical protein
MNSAEKYRARVAKPDTSPLWNVFKVQPVEQRRMLWVLSVAYTGIELQALRGWLARLAWRGRDGVPLAELLDESLCARWWEIKLVERDGVRLRCAGEIIELVTRDAVAAGSLDEIVAAMPSQLAQVPRFTRFQDGGMIRGHLRLLLYRGREAEALLLLRQSLGKGQLPELEGAGPLIGICVEPYDAKWFARLSPAVQFQVLAPLANEAARFLGDARAVWETAKRNLGESRDTQVRLWLAEQWLFRGEPEAADAALSGLDESRALALSGWSLFLQGRDREAIEAFRQSQGRDTRKRSAYVPEFAGVCYILTLLRSREPALLEEARKQTELAIKQASGDFCEPIFRMLGDLVAIFRGELTLDRSVWLGRASLAVEPYLDLIRVLARRWLGGEVSDPQLARLPKYCQSAQIAGWGWYQGESANLLKCLKRKPDECRVPRKLPYLSIVELSRPQEAWERALLALRGVAESPDQAPASEADRRMTWRLARLDEESFAIEPKEQKRGKMGGWSRGRSISLERLYQGGEAFDYLTSQDRAICQAIATEVVYESYARHPKTLYQFDQERAIEAAVGHPLIFWADDPDRSVEVRSEEPALEIRKDGRELLLRLEPYPPFERDRLLLQEGPQRLKVVAFTPEHRRIADILGPNGIHVPAAAKNQVVESITAIAPLLNIHSDIGMGDSNSEQVAPDNTPHVHLKPMGEGFSMDCYIQPFGEKGPVFRPGEGRGTVFSEIDGRTLQTERDREAELEAAQQVLTACPGLDPEAEWHWILDDPELALDSLLNLQELGERIVLDWPQGRKIRLTRAIGVGNMRIAIRKKRDWFGVDGELRIDENRVLSMKELIALLDSAKGRFVRIGEDEFLTITRDLRRRIEMLRDLGEDGEISPLAVESVEELIDGMQVKVADEWRQRLAELAEIRDWQPQLPSTLCAELRDYQLEGYRWMARLARWGAGACLADDMGLGKTVQALALILERAPQGPTLILAPTSVCGNWVEEATRFAPTLKIHRFGTGNRRKMVEQAAPFDLVVCSYGLMQSESEVLSAIEWTTIVADEAQAIKNVVTKRSKAAMALRGGFRLITTGTPIENHLGELWNLFRFINPGLLGSLQRFNQRFATPIEQTGDNLAKQRLKQLIRPFILRRLKSDVLSELPERTEITIHVELSEEETTFYQALRAQALERVSGSGLPSAQRRVQILAEITRLRQACCNPRLILPESTIPSAKLNAFGEILEELLENRHKALVFSQFVGHLRLLREYLDHKGIVYQYLDGSTPERKRGEAVNAFQKGEGELFLISLKAGGSGLNLTAADYVLHMDPWWNPAVEDQASDRAHRIGQQRPVTVYRLVAKETIEEKIVRLHSHKRDLADNLLEGSDMSGRMSVDEMMELLSGNVG